MAGKTTPTAKNLEALGAARLAALLLELGDGDPAVKRRLRLELAGAAGPREAAHEIRKRLATLARGQTYLEGQRVRAFVDDLELQRRAILTQVAPGDPGAALELLWQFLDVADSAYARCDDSNGTVTSAFRAACRDLGEVARAAKPDPRALADRAFTTLDGPDYGHRDGLIALLAPALGETGLVHLRERVEALARTPVPVPAEKDRRKVGWSSAGAIYEDEIEASRRQSLVRLALLEITDALGDLDGYIAQHGALAREVPEIAADIANRLLAAGRAEEAWAAVENVPADRRTAYGAEPWREARIAVMEARGMAAEAQAFRWECFARFLDPAMLRAHLKRLPDFEDVEAEERALAHVQGSRRFHDALWFFLRWPDLSRAAALVTARAAELDGDAYALLTPAGDALDAGYPLAATLVRRAMIDFALSAARSSRYRHAARHLLECRSLAEQVADWGPFESHQAYLSRLRAEHGRKAAFWQQVG